MVAHAGFWRVRQIPVVIVLLVAALGLTGCTRGGDHDSVQASMSVSPQAALVDQPVTVSVGGLPAGARQNAHRQGHGYRRHHLVGNSPVPGDLGRGAVAESAVAGRQLHRGQPHGPAHPHGPATGLGARRVPPPRGRLRRRPAGQRQRPSGRHSDHSPTRPGRGRRGREASRGQPAVGSTPTCTCPSTPRAGGPQCWSSAAPTGASPPASRPPCWPPTATFQSFGPDGTVVAVNCYVSNIEACQAIPTIKPGS